MINRPIFIKNIINHLSFNIDEDTHNNDMMKIFLSLKLY